MMAETTLTSMDNSEFGNPAMALTRCFNTGSIWADSTERLQRLGHLVAAPAFPLRGVDSDAAHLASAASKNVVRVIELSLGPHDGRPGDPAHWPGDIMGRATHPVPGQTPAAVLART